MQACNQRSDHEEKLQLIHSPSSGTSMIGQKVVMAVTGAVLVSVCRHAHDREPQNSQRPCKHQCLCGFLREVGRPELDYGQLLWIVRIVLLICVVFHVTAVVRLTRLNWAARPTGYNIKKNIKTTIAAQTMRWGGVLLLAFVIFHLLHLTCRRRGLPARRIPASCGVPECNRGVVVLARRLLLHRGNGCVGDASLSRNLEQPSDARFQHFP